MEIVKWKIAFKEAEKWSFKSKVWKPKISSCDKKPELLWDLTYFNEVKFARNFRSCSKNWIKKQDGRCVAMVTKGLQTLNLKFDQIMFNSLVLTCERNFEVTITHFLLNFFWEGGGGREENVWQNGYLCLSFEHSRRGPILRLQMRAKEMFNRH